MGVHGLWQLIEPSGRPVPLETLESKILAVDISIWLHQAVKGFQDSKGAPIPHAHLLGIYHRVCKLLYFKVKPIFIFDGGIPSLKKQTIAKRNQVKLKNNSEAERLQKQLLSTLLKHSAISKILSEKTKASIVAPPKKTNKHENMYVLPAPELDATTSSSTDEDDTEDTDSSPTKHWDLHTIDMTSTYFKSLPVDVRHDILTDLKETRKQNSWGKLHEIPKESDEFSGYQMKRLLKRQAVQSALEETEKEMGGHSLSLAELESLLKDHGVATVNDVGKHIASDENTRYLYIKDVKQALEKARKDQQKREFERDNTNIYEKIHNEGATVQLKNKADQEFKDDLQKAISLSLQEEPSTSKLIFSESSDKGKIEFSFLENYNDADFQTDSSEECDNDCSDAISYSSAQNYMIEYSGLTPKEIAKIMEDKKNISTKTPWKRKAKNKQIPIKTVNISDSDDSNELIKPSIEDKPGLKKNINEIYKGTLKKDNVQIIRNTRGTEVIQEQMDNETNVINLDKCHEIASGSITKTFSNNRESNSNRSSNEEVQDAINSDRIKIATILQNKTTNPQETNFGVAKRDNNLEENDEESEENVNGIEIMSHSDESSNSIEFQDVCENKDSTDCIEIKINPKQTLNEQDDLFSDIFSENTKQKHLATTIRPNSKLEDALFHEPFENKNMEEELHEINKVGATKDMKRKTSILVSNETEKKEETTKIKNSEKICLEVTEDMEKIPKLKLSTEEMQNLKANLQREKIDLMVEKSMRERIATNITDQMYQEAQELLELFGMPYIIAPMEAEAQCAFLDAIELTDGSITDDSDIWLFGGRTVYKNFFNQSKYVMEFKAENIKHHFKLTREQMILLALLVGSDYTAGIQGIGPVTALEILAAFPHSQKKQFTLSHTELLSGLKEFQSWISKGKTAGPGRSALKSKLKNISISDNFPSLQVVEAYMEPTIDTSREAFSWGKPDFEALTNFARLKFGWPTRKTEEILKPVIKRTEENQTQTSIKDFFKTTNKLTHDAKEKMSKRVKSAIDRIGKTPEELIEEEMRLLSESRQKNTRKKIRNKTGEKTGTDLIKIETNKNAKEEDTGIAIKQKRTRKKLCEDSPMATNKMTNKNISESKKPRKADSVIEEHISETTDVVGNELVGTSFEQEKDVNSDELEAYKNIAKDLKQRRKRRNELTKKVDATVIKKKQMSRLAKKPSEMSLNSLNSEEKNNSGCDLYQCCSQNITNRLEKCEDFEEQKLKMSNQLDSHDRHDLTKNKSIIDDSIRTIPEGLAEDTDVVFLQATASRSLKRVKEIDREVTIELNQETKKKPLPAVHKKEVIHQKLRNKNELLRNKMKAIEVFRKSRKGPGFVEKRKKNVVLPKNDAGLSETSSDE